MLNRTAILLLCTALAAGAVIPGCSACSRNLDGASSISYAQVGEKEKNLHVEGFATETDTSKYEQQVTALQGIATPSDLTDTWVEQPFEQATPSDVSAQDTEGADTLPADDAEAKPVVID